MLLLALDTSTPAVTAGIASLDATSREVDVLAERVTVDARAHGELLTPQLTEAARMAGTTLRELDAVVCGVGPGPFTGLRVGMVTAAALGHGLGLPVYPVCGLDAIAAEATGEPLLVVTDARRKEVYWARYDATGVRVDGPAVNAPLDVAAAGAVRVAGHGARVYPDVFALPAVAPLYPTPRGLVRVAAAAIIARAEPEPLTPRYLRRPDAQEPGERKRVRQ